MTKFEIKTRVIFHLENFTKFQQENGCDPLIETEKGEEVRIIATDRIGGYPIVGLVKIYSSEEKAYYFDKNGVESSREHTQKQLYIVTKKMNNLCLLSREVFNISNLQDHLNWGTPDWQKMMVIRILLSTSLVKSNFFELLERFQKNPIYPLEQITFSKEEIQKMKETFFS